jgi:two-component system cell cycle response regulator
MSTCGCGRPPASKRPRDQGHGVTDRAAEASVLDWSNELLGTRSLAALQATLARGPALSDEMLTGALVLVDARHELRLLLAGESAEGGQPTGLRFVDALASVAPALGALHAPWSGAYHAADHGLVFGSEHEITDLVLLPLPGGPALQGVYAVGGRGQPPAFAALGSQWLRHVGGQTLASAERLFQRARLLRAGVVDPLTGWNGRHYFLARLREQVATCSRHRETACCLVVDFDGLGAFNESHGVAAGDAALLEAGARLEAQVRASDAFAHLGEDEFAVLLPDTDAARALPLVERLLAALRAAPVQAGTAILPLRASIGVAVLDGAELPASFERKAIADQWLSEAHAGLHRAKRQGGDGHAVNSAGAASAPGRSALPPVP